MLLSGVDDDVVEAAVRAMDEAVQAAEQADGTDHEELLRVPLEALRVLLAAQCANVAESLMDDSRQHRRNANTALAWAQQALAYGEDSEDSDRATFCAAWALDELEYWRAAADVFQQLTSHVKYGAAANLRKRNEKLEKLQATLSELEDGGNHPTKLRPR